MNVEKLRQILRKRINLHPEDPTVEIYWKEEADILSENIDETIGFFENECTVEELTWFCEVFDDIIDKTQSKILISVWEKRLEEITDTDEKNIVETDIGFAKLKLKD